MYFRAMSLRHAILGFLAHGPLTGYDLRKAMDTSVAHFWPADQAQIYKTLSRLVQDGLVEVDVVEQNGRPNRREHRVLPPGLAELDAWLAAPMEYSPSREPFLLKIFFAGRLGPDRARRVLEERAAEAAELLAELSAIQQATSAALADAAPAGVGGLALEQRLRLATLDNGIHHAEAELAWVEDTLRLVEEHS